MIKNLISTEMLSTEGRIKDELIKRQDEEPFDDSESEIESISDDPHEEEHYYQEMGLI